MNPGSPGRPDGNGWYYGPGRFMDAPPELALAGSPGAGVIKITSARPPTQPLVWPSVQRSTSGAGGGGVRCTPPGR